MSVQNIDKIFFEQHDKREEELFLIERKAETDTQREGKDSNTQTHVPMGSQRDKQTEKQRDRHTDRQTDSPWSHSPMG